MNDQSKTKRALIQELTSLRQRIAALEQKAATPAPVPSDEGPRTVERGRIEEGRPAPQVSPEHERIDEETAALAEIGRVIGSTLNIDEVYERFAAQVRKLIPFDRIHVNLNSPEGDYFTIAYVSGLDITTRRPGDRVRLPGSITDIVSRTKAGLRLHASADSDITSRFPGASALTTVRIGMRSIMAVPLIYGGEAIGALHFRSKTPDAYREKDLRLAERIGAQIAGAIGSAKLFSDHQLAEEALRESEARFRGIYEASPIGIELYDRQGRLLDANRACLDIFGISDVSMVKDFNLFEDPNLSEELKEQLRRGEPVRYEMPFDFDKVTQLKLYETAKKGTAYLDVLITPFQGAQRESDIGYLVHVRDITERRRAEEELRRSETKYRGLIETAPDGYVMSDMQGRILDCNGAYLDMLGYTLEEIKKLSYQEITPPKWHAMEEEIVRDQYIGRGRSDAYEKEYIRKDGTVIAVSLRGSLIRDEKGMSAALWGFVRDITKLKRTEEERRILEERLHRAEKTEMVGNLAGGVAHDLNNLLGTLIGNAELLALNVNRTSPLRKMVEGIMTSGQKAAEEVQDLLTIARQGVILREPNNLNRITSDLLQTPQMNKMFLSYPLVTVRTRFDRDLLDIDASVIHIERALANLVSNALHAISGKGTITIGTENRYLEHSLSGYETVPKGEYAVLTMSDTGRGIHPEHMQHLFEPFYIRKVLRQGGSGLGLSVIWGALKDHEGYIDVVSTPGQGTTVSLYFPALRDSTMKCEEPSVAGYRGHGETILVVDDDEDQCSLAEMMLTGLGYGVRTAASGEEALEYLGDHEVDLVVLDMIMEPGIDGYETYRRILEMKSRQKAVIFSGFAKTERVKMAQNLGAGEFLMKPYLRERLGAAVRRELDRK